MSLNTKLQALKSVLTETLNNANEILVEKGKEPANNIERALDDIASLPSGDDTLSRIALEAPIGEEIGTVDLKLDSSWGNLKPYAFYQNLKLKSADLSDCVNMTEMPTNCFGNSSNLTTFIFPPNIKNIRGLKATNVREIQVPKSVEQIGDCGTNHSLQNVTFPTDSMVADIAGYAFEDCDNYTNVVLPPLLKTLNDFVFYMTSEKAKKIYFRRTPTTIKSKAFSTTTITDIYMPCGQDEAPSGSPWNTNATLHFGWKSFRHIEIITAPEKTSYKQGDVFNPSGMEVGVYDENYGIDGDMGEIIASDELGFDNLEYSKEPLLSLIDKQPFYIYYTDKYGERHIADVTITVVEK